MVIFFVSDCLQGGVKHNGCSNPKEYEYKTGRKFSSQGPSIHRTGSLRGMVKSGFWPKGADVVRHGNYIYLQ